MVPCDRESPAELRSHLLPENLGFLAVLAGSLLEDGAAESDWDARSGDQDAGPPRDQRSLFRGAAGAGGKRVELAVRAKRQPLARLAPANTGTWLKPTRPPAPHSPGAAAWPYASYPQHATAPFACSP